jgi:hypothetical protein
MMALSNATIVAIDYSMGMNSARFTSKGVVDTINL